MSRTEKVAASFRDPSGFLFRHDNVLYRQINHCYQSDYDQLMNSGLYDAFVKEVLLISHEEVEIAPAEPGFAYRVIRPKLVPFISYPYEWSFSQLKDAALLTINIQIVSPSKRRPPSNARNLAYIPCYLWSVMM